MGDIINSAFILEYIKLQYPNATLDWFCEEAFAPILEDHPFLDTIHTINLKKIKKQKSFSLLISLVKKLKALVPYDIVIDLQGLVKSALISRILGKNRFGFDKKSIREPFASKFYNHRCSISYAENSIWRTATLINFALNMNISKKMITNKNITLAIGDRKESIDPFVKKPNIVFVIGSSQAYKNYPIEKINKTLELFPYRVLLIWGSIAEYKDAKQLAKSSKNAIVAPKLTLQELKQLISNCELVIGNDTGPTHLAWAFNRPSITLFGATPAQKMIWETPINIALESKSNVNPLKINKQDFSIAEIDPNLIYKTGEFLLNAQN